MLQLGRVLLIGGVVVALLCQLRIVFAAFDASVGKALLCLVLPGYIIFYGRRYETGLLKGWLVGLGLIVVGMGALSIAGTGRATPRPPAATATAAPHDGADAGGTTGDAAAAAMPAAPAPAQRSGDEPCVEQCRELARNGQLRAGVTQAECERELCP